MPSPRVSTLLLLILGTLAPCFASAAKPSLCPVLLGAPEFSAHSLRDRYVQVPARPIFSMWDRWWIRKKLERLQSETDRTSLKEKGWRSFQGLYFYPESWAKPYDRDEQTMRQFLGERAYGQLHAYAMEVRALLESRFHGKISFFSVGLRSAVLPDRFDMIRVKVDGDGKAVNGHRHLGPASPNYDSHAPEWTRSYITASVLKTETGPATVVRDENGRPLSAQNGEATILTDAWHAVPVETGPRLIVLISAYFYGSEYEGYYPIGAYEDGEYRQE